MRQSIITFCLALSAFYLLESCRFNPNIQGPGSAILQGVWEEEPAKFRDSLLQYTQHRFKFTCDSFYASLTTASKVNYYEDSCYHDGTWKEYAKGNYIVQNDTLYIIGTFTKEDFRQKLSGCYRIGQYLPVFLIRKAGKEKIELLNLQQFVPVTLKLKEKITCNPQPL